MSIWNDIEALAELNADLPDCAPCTGGNHFECYEFMGLPEGVVVACGCENDIHEMEIQ